MIKKPYRSLLLIGLAMILLQSVLLAMHHMPHSIWHDEGLTINIVQRSSLAGVLRGAMTHKPFPPLFFFLVHASNRVIAGELGLRLVSLLFGLLSIVATFWLGSLFVNRWAGLWAAWFLATTPGVFFYFVDANPYTILIFWSALSTGLILVASKRDTPASWIAYTLAALGGLASHTLFIFHIMGHCLFFMRARTADLGCMDELRTRDFWQRQKRFLASLSIVLVIWLGWVGYYLLSKGYANAPILDRAISFGALFSMAGMIPGPLTYDSWPHGCLFACLVAAGFIIFWRKDREVWLRLMLLWIPPIIGITLFVRTASVFTAYRYGLGVFPITCIMLTGILNLKQSDRGSISNSSRWKVLLQVAMGLCIACGTLRLALSSSDYFTYSDWKGCALYLEQQVGPRDMVWFEGEEYSFPLAYYFSRRDQIVSNPSGDQDLRGVEDLTLRQSRVASQGGTVWVIMPFFQNRNALIEKFTRVTSRTGHLNALQLDSLLQSRAGLRLLQDRDFDRIRVFRVSAQ
jgi:hypothetical protein